MSMLSDAIVFFHKVEMDIVFSDDLIAHDALNPLLLVALIYLTLVVLLTKLLSIVEKKLAQDT